MISCGKIVARPRPCHVGARSKYPLAGQTTSGVGPGRVGTVVLLLVPFFFPAVEWSSDRSLSESEGWLCLWHGRGVVVGCRVAWLPGPGAKAERACCCVRAAAKVTRASHSDSRGAVLAQALTQYARLSLSDKSSLVCGLLG